MAWQPEISQAELKIQAMVHLHVCIIYITSCYRWWDGALMSVVVIVSRVGWPSDQMQGKIVV